MPNACDRDLESRDRGLGGGEVEFRLLDVEFGGELGAQSIASELSGLRLGGDVLLRDSQSFLKSAQLDVVRRDVRGQDDPEIAERLDVRLQVGLSRVDRSGDPSPEVELPPRFEPHRVRGVGAVDAGNEEGVHLFAQPSAGAESRSVDIGDALAAIHLVERACALDAGECGS